MELADAEAALTSAQTNLSTGQAAYSRLAADDADVALADLAVERAAMAVEVTFEALEDTPYRGQVLGIDPLALRDGNGLVSYAVQLSLDKPDDHVRDGMSGTVDFILREKTGILVLPKAAIRMVDGTQMVTARNDAGEVVFAPVTTGLKDGRQVEILSGLNAGDVVLIAEK